MINEQGKPLPLGAAHVWPETPRLSSLSCFSVKEQTRTESVQGSRHSASSSRLTLKPHSPLSRSPPESTNCTWKIFKGVILQLSAKVVQIKHKFAKKKIKKILPSKVFSLTFCPLVLLTQFPLEGVSLKGNASIVFSSPWYQVPGPVRLLTTSQI